jgi:O-antigen ligase/Tfp pilus assembly protein PilF
MTKRTSPPKQAPLMPWLGTGFFSLAVISSLYFHGFVADFFCITQVLLLLWLLSSLWHQGRRSIPLPRSRVALFLAAYVGWLALTLIWGTVPNYNIITFWWLASLPLAFWLYTITPEREGLWLRAAPGMLVLVLILAIHATYQLMIRGWEPKSVFLDINSYAVFLALIALPAAGYFLAGFTTRAKDNIREIVLGASLFMLVFAMALTSGRGVMIVFVAGMAVLVAVAWPRVSRSATMKLVVLTAIGLIAGNVAAEGRTTTRLMTLIDPETAGYTRFLIWEQAWEIIKESPWLGKGLGTFGLVFPAHRNPLDSSAGFMVHNDYLQIWLEAGLPGLVLLIAVYTAILAMFLRVLRRRRRQKGPVIEITGLFCGLLVVAMHSFVNFNLYILPTSLVAGLVLARFHELAIAGQRGRVWKFQPTRYLHLGTYRLVMSLLVLIGVGFWLSHSLANYSIQKAVHLVNEGELDAADEALSRAHRLSPDSEATLLGRAELYRYVISAAPASAAEDKRRLFHAAMETLERAGQLNPYRADIPFLRARLHWLVKDMAGENWAEQTVHEYKRAIHLEPRFYTARVELASFWLERGEVDKARELLERGMAYAYVGQERILPYYHLTMALRRQAGDVTGAQEIAQRIAAFQEIPKEKRPVPLDQVKFFSFYDLWRWFWGLFSRA